MLILIPYTLGSAQPEAPGGEVQRGPHLITIPDIGMQFYYSKIA